MPHCKHVWKGRFLFFFLRLAVDQLRVPSVETLSYFSEMNSSVIGGSRLESSFLRQSVDCVCSLDQWSNNILYQLLIVAGFRHDHIKAAGDVTVAIKQRCGEREVLGIKLAVGEQVGLLAKGRD